MRQTAQRDLRGVGTMAGDLDQLFRRIEDLATARGLAEVARGTSYGTPCLKVRNRTFLRLRDADTLVLQCPADQKALLMDLSPDIYYETDHYVGYEAVLVRLSEISDEELSLRIEDAWRFRAPRTRRAAPPAAKN